MSEENLNREQLLARFAEVQDISKEEAIKLVGGETADDILNNIRNFTLSKIASNIKLNRAQRRALQKKNKNAVNAISNTAEKINYIDLITKLRELNERKEKEENENSNENN